MSNKLLVVIDMQNDFITGPLGTPEAQAIVKKVKARISQATKNDETVAYTRDTHNANYLNTQEGKNLPVPHCIKGSKGWEISEKLDTASDKIIDKPTFGSFELAEYISTLADVDEIELIGLCTDICVISNAMILKARFTETPIKVDSSCCAGVTPESHANALSAMKMCQINCF